MTLDNFLATVRLNQIPPSAPAPLNAAGWGSCFSLADAAPYWDGRRECTSRGMWAIVTLDWTRQLADWIGERKALEIMAGAGWLAKALHDHGVDIVATDSQSWDDRHDQMIRLCPIEQQEATEAVCKYADADLLICSWPPYGDGAIYRAAEAWGSERPIVYIGEGEGGCNAPDEFWSHFRELEDAPDIPLKSWRGIHDHIFIGNYMEGPA